MTFHGILIGSEHFDRNISNVFEFFVKFKILVENLFSCNIKQMQSDGRGR
jgi:hypothetical protein